MRYREAWLCSLVLILLAAAPLLSQPASSPGVLRFQWGLGAGLEGAGPFIARVERMEGSQGTVSVHYTLRSNTARSGEDFLPFTGTVTFADGDNDPKALVIPVLDDFVPEKTETLQLILSDPTGGATLGVPARALIEIRDDDTPSPLLGAATAPIEVERDNGPLFPQLRSHAVTALTGGGFVVVWSNWADRFLLVPYAGSRLYDVAGNPILDSLWISNSALGMKVAAQPGGGFTVTGDAYNIISTFNIESLGTYGRRYDGVGQPRTPYFNLPFVPSATAAGQDGGLLTLSGSPAVVLSRFGRLGQPLGSPRTVTASGQSVTLASDALGRGVVAWIEGSAGNRLFVRQLTALGRWRTRAFAVDSVLDRRPGAIALAVAPDGRFVVVWEGSSDGDGLGIFGRRFTASGEPAGPVFQVNSETAGDQTQPQVAIQADGRFLVIWQCATNVHGQYFAADGSVMGVEEDLMTGEAESYDARLAGDPAGHYTLVWRSMGFPLNRGAITARRFMMP